MVIHIREVNFGFVAHVSLDLVTGVVSLGEGGDTVNVVSSETVDYSLDGLESAFVQD